MPRPLALALALALAGCVSDTPAPAAPQADVETDAMSSRTIEEDFSGTA